MSGAVDSIKQKIIAPAVQNTKNAFGAATYAFHNPGDPLGAGLAPIKNAFHTIDEEGGNLGIKKSTEQKHAEDAAIDANNEQTARSTAYNDALKDANIDTTTHSEINAAYAAGNDSASLAAIIANARQGTGVYGVRRLNQNQNQLAATIPGRSQTLGGGGSIL
jgi:hypothetical protein